MYSGSSLHVECIFPFGVLCLSAWKIMVVKMVFAVCAYIGVVESQRTQASVSVLL